MWLWWPLTDQPLSLPHPQPATKNRLEDAINDFPGCAVVISHDRYFLDRVATHILAFEDDGNVVWFEVRRLIRMG